MNEVTKRDWEKEVTNSSIPVLVDFWAPWCGPCRQLMPILEELSQEFEGRVKFIKCNVEENTDLMRNHQVMSLPTLLIFRGTEQIGQIIGKQPKERITDIINASL